MEKNYLIQLTQNLYKLTLLFPKKEPLRYKMREVANDILADLIGGQTSEKPSEVRPRQVLESLEILDGFFEVAKAQNWVQAVEVLRVQEEYNRIKIELKKISRGQTSAKLIEVRPLQGSLQGSGGGAGQVVNSRQQEILEFLKENGRAQVWQLKQVFPEVTKRTLRRDFERLLKQGVIERIGEKNATFYQLKRSLAPFEDRTG